MPYTKEQEQAKIDIQIKIDYYKKLLSEDKLKDYSEEDTKKDFILPLFHYLGWETEIHEEVQAEEYISGDKVDYSFRLNGIPKFFLEAKSFSETIQKPKFSEQAIDYSYHKGCTWAILSDFTTLKIFNSECKFDPIHSLFNKFECPDDYITKFDELWVLSKESFNKNLLDAEAEKWNKKIPRIPINEQLLKDFTRFRTILSNNISKRNPTSKISEEELDESVQRILDRLIFIRNCEDRELEAKDLISVVRDYEQKNKKILKRFKEIFGYFDEQYNSKLFAKHLCDELEIDDSILAEIINGLYATKDGLVNYNFKDIASDVLGNIYEDYLGHILRKSKLRAKVTESSSKRKSQAAYFTPPYIVDYIIKNTLGEALKNIASIDTLDVIDIACGSGSFLIKVFDYLYQYELHNNPAYGQTEIDFKYGLPFTEKSKIVNKCIFGVDVDKKAVEIAQLNLLLKITEKAKRLPLLNDNIKCGNSLIDEKYVVGEKAFNWKTQFPNQKFNIIIGNPPYVKPHRIDKAEKAFMQKTFLTFKEKSNLYSCFMEKGISLLEEGGLISFIVPNTWVSLNSFRNIRKYILDTCRVVKLVQLPKKVFKDATVETIIFVFKKDSDEIRRNKNSITVESLSKTGVVTFIKKLDQAQLLKNYNNTFEMYSDNTSKTLLANLSKTKTKLRSVVNFMYGLKTGDDKKFILDSCRNKDCKKLIRSENISSYKINYAGEYVWYAPTIMKKNCVSARIGEPERFESNKIIVSRMGKNLIAAYDEQQYYVKDCMMLLPKEGGASLKYLTGLLNSKLLNYYYKNYFVTIDVLKFAILELPIIIANPVVIANVENKVTNITNQLLAIKTHKNTDDYNSIEESANKIKDEIDELVFDIYNIEKEDRAKIKEFMK